MQILEMSSNAFSTPANTCKKRCSTTLCMFNVRTVVRK